ncbi:RING-H2 finger protein atl60 [Phtheirospermum japonicum]|uniref:RING-type E3 ubiquitin transferase n=1 Tax=Phtheirospermum japonicum TaxID=374723 RepID=A0A830BRU9_9LAMI|nr:RING-H2 finger protein atl60 [Phtheirospermum japonicum]
MSDPSERYGGAGIIELTGKIMVVAIVLLLFIVVFVFCLHLYAKYFWYRRRENPNSTATASRRRRLDFASGHHEIAVSRRGLEPSLLKTLPILIFDPKQFKDGLECAVCLSDISQGEKTRLLPKCNHGFHLDCIDMWFESHSTCPLCRNPVKIQNSSDEPPPEAAIQAPVAENPAEAPNFPTNVLIWGDETQVSTFTPVVEENNHNQANSAIGIIVEPSSSSSSMSSTSGTPDGIISTVDVIPRQINEDDEQKSAVPTRLRSLKRLLSYNNRRVNPSSSRNLDLEQGGRGQS